MTGYGRAVQELHGRNITVEVKSVNHRYFDCTVKTSRMFSFLEDPVKKAAQGAVSRGKMDIYVSVDDSHSDDVQVVFNEHIFEAYLHSMKDMAEKYGLRDDVSVSSLGRYPEVFSIEKREADADEIRQDVLAVLEAALAEYTAMRAREGERMYEDISSRGKYIGEMVSGIAARAPEVVAEYRERITQRIREILDGVQPDEGRLLTEAALFADRTAIDEELVRLGSHLSQLEDMLQDTVPVGRKLDFLVQELNRETNTIGSKANDLTITRTVVDIKAEIEKIREQVQNIE
ncbi:MAG: YicC family protein [Ruminococcaceae bacterium]|nr:YicC family protein [Oscillospiraceae bacterium]